MTRSDQHEQRTTLSDSRMRLALVLITDRYGQQLTRTELMTLLYLIRFADANECAELSISDLAPMIGNCKRNTERVIASLTRKGLIESFRNNGGHDGIAVRHLAFFNEQERGSASP